MLLNMNPPVNNEALVSGCQIGNNIIPQVDCLMSSDHKWPSATCPGCGASVSFYGRFSPFKAHEAAVENPPQQSRSTVTS